MPFAPRKKILDLLPLQITQFITARRHTSTSAPRNQAAKCICRYGLGRPGATLSTGGQLMESLLVLSGYYDYRLVAISAFISILAAYVALDLAERITTARGTSRLAWLYGGAAAMGIGIWAMHYVGMVAFH